ncbi:MAG TPA: mechanosensitive ion channel domain-containing protein [Verrucomicrobiae bacterium]|nr:mechanosensitive ion channel domain-containing protein [Verrucomicrobiae bacterium]
MGRDTIYDLAGAVREPLARLLEKIFGSGVHQPIAGAITWVDAGISCLVVLLLLTIHAIAAGWLRWRRSRESSQATWQHDLLQSFAGPLYLAIWVAGIYMAVVPLLQRAETQDETSAGMNAWNWCFDAGMVIALFWLFIRATRVAEKRLLQWSALSKTNIDDLLVPLGARALRVVAPAVAVIVTVPLLDLPPDYNELIGKLSGLLIVGVVSWILIQLVKTGEKVLLTRYDITVADNLEARKVYTQVKVLGKALYVVIAIFSIASGLMLFEEVRRFGTSILASAGVFGIIVGFAAQKTIANLFAGFQLAMTQPIRLDDVVIVENEWGRVEEITLTYVVIKIWDDRRLIAPLSYFIEKPFQNWTRVSAALLGSVFVWTDYSVPIAELRPAIKSIVESCADWDKRFWNLQVTDSTERAVQLRVLATARDSGSAWNLRCEIREKLVEYIQQHHPTALPRFRAEVDAPARNDDAALTSQSTVDAPGR